MSSLDDIFTRLNTWKANDGEILVHWTSSLPQSSVNFTASIGEAEEPELHLFGDADLRVFISLERAKNISEGIDPERFSLDLPGGVTLLVSLA